MICWHDWNVRDTETRLLFRKLYNLNYKWLFAIASFIALPVVAALGRSLSLSVSTGAKIYFSLVFSVLLIVIFSGILFLAIASLDSATKLEDKVCLKCHKVVLKSSEHREEIDAYEEEQKEIKAEEDSLKDQLLQEANDSFNHSKVTWEESK